MAIKLTGFETGIFILYILIAILIGFISGRKGKQNTSKFFLAGWQLPWYVWYNIWLSIYRL